jgi:RNA polymerase sigma-70 factor (ECF subfamily)
VRENHSYGDLTDRELISEIRRGRSDLFEFIVKRYEKSVAGIIYSILGNLQNSDDLGQDIFIRAFKGLAAFRFKSEFRTYLTRIAINVCIDEMKRESQVSFVNENAEQLAELPGIDEQEQYALRDLVQSALLTLHPDQRMVVVLRIMEGYSTKETARILNMREGTVMSKLSRGLKKLNELLISKQIVISK